MGKMILVLGGARSGKSNFACSLADKYKRVAFVATAEGGDGEMRRRIRLHRRQRPEHWKTYEEPRNILRALSAAGQDHDCVVVDCLTLWVSNLLLARKSEAEIARSFSEVLAGIKKGKFSTVFVSNEVGLGLVPANRLGRLFRDTAGRINRIAAAAADEVYFLFSGIPLRLKPGGTRGISIAKERE